MGLDARGERGPELMGPVATIRGLDIVGLSAWGDREPECSEPPETELCELKDSSPSEVLFRRMVGLFRDGFFANMTLASDRLTPYLSDIAANCLPSSCLSDSFRSFSGLRRLSPLKGVSPVVSVICNGGERILGVEKPWISGEAGLAI